MLGFTHPASTAHGMDVWKSLYLLLFMFIISIINISNLRRHCMLKIDSPAPEFSLQSTQDKISLGDYKGKYVVLFFYPLDFTPV